MFLPKDTKIGAVLADYLVVGRCYESQLTRDALLQLARSKEITLGRLRVSGGSIWFDALKIGRIQAANGSASRWGWKLKFFFTGSAFRPVHAGGAALNFHDAFTFISLFEARASIPEELDHALRARESLRERVDRARAALASAEGAASGLLAQVEALPEAVERAREDLAEDLEAYELADRIYLAARQQVGAINDVRATYTTIDRLDYAVEIELPDAEQIAHLWSATPSDVLPSRWAARGQVTSRASGTTVYLGTAHEPLAKRGESALARVYQYARPSYASKPSTPDAELRRAEEAARAKKLRVEVELPSVRNVNPARTLGVRAGAELAAQLLARLVGLGAPLPVRRQQPGDKPGAYVPELPIDDDDTTGWLGAGTFGGATDSGKPFLSHAGSELRRLALCGVGNMRNIARIQLTYQHEFQIAAQAEAVELHEGLARPALELDELDEALELLATWRVRLFPDAPAPEFRAGFKCWHDLERQVAYNARYHTLRDPSGLPLALD